MQTYIDTISLAPMEGLTTRTFRDTFCKYYKGISKCYTPFLSPNQNHSFQKKELKEVERREEFTVETVPQFLCNDPEHFIWAASEMAKLGHTEVNFNLGCPSGTVVSKKKGSGFLLYPDELDSFFDKVCPEMERMGIKLSVKTRLGRNDPEEFVKILEVFNKYPFSELIIHPRIQKDFYKEPVRREWFDYALENSKNPLVYNGDIYTIEDMSAFAKKYSKELPVMMGRGLIGRPFLLEDAQDKPLDYGKLKAFHDELLAKYQEVVDGFSLLCKMKEAWEYLGPALEIDDALLKKIRKSKTVSEYKIETARALAKT